MNRKQFQAVFSNQGLAVLPVIHVLDNVQAEKNARLAFEAGCPGIFLINHDFSYPEFLPIIRHVRQQFRDLWIGVNFLAATGKIAFPILADLQNEGVRVDAYWADDARIDERQDIDNQNEATEIQAIRRQCGWGGLYFGGTAFKKQREVDPSGYSKSATLACDLMDVVTTSGIATGHSADICKIQTFRNACGDTPLALASGITPENVSEYLPYVDGVLVSTGINIKGDFYNIDPSRLAKLMRVARTGENT